MGARCYWIIESLLDDIFLWATHKLIDFASFGPIIMLLSFTHEQLISRLTTLIYDHLRIPKKITWVECLASSPQYIGLVEIIIVSKEGK